MNRPLRAWIRRNPLWRSYRVGLLLLRTLYIINHERTRVVRAHDRGDMDVRPNIQALVRILREFRETAVDLGGLLIKLGQFLGARVDLLPQEALEELAGLQDDVPPERFEDIQRVLQQEWQAPLDEVCSVVEPKPAGSASLGQVHRAQLRDGRMVAVKVRRPGISAIVRTDLRTLHFVLRVVAWLVPVANKITDLEALYREFSRTVGEELNYIQEGRNAQQFATIFADDPGIVVPAVITEFSTRRVLVLEWLEGIKVTDFAALDAARVDRSQLAERLAASYLKQVLEAGFFHADPHPGNILIQPAAEGDRIVYLDFGMMGTVTASMKDGLRDCFTGVVAQNAAAIVRGLDTLGFLGEGTNHQTIERAVALMLAHFGGGFPTPGAGGRSANGGAVDAQVAMSDMATALYDQPLRLPAQFAFFGRMASMLLGLTLGLAPRFNFIAVATPYARQFIGRGGIAGVLNLFGVDSLGTLSRDLAREGLAAVRALAALPRRLESVLQRAEQGELHLVLEGAAEHALLKNPRGRRRRGVAAMLSRPIPLWLPLGLVGGIAVTRLIGRWSRTRARDALRAAALDAVVDAAREARGPDAR